MTGDLKLHEMDLLFKMCPLALVQIGFLAVATGEVSEIIARWDDISHSFAPQVVLLSGILSFALNVSSFIANKVTSALTLCIAANVKQVCFPPLRSDYVQSMNWMDDDLGASCCFWNIVLWRFGNFSQWFGNSYCCIGKFEVQFLKM